MQPVSPNPTLGEEHSDHTPTGKNATLNSRYFLNLGPLFQILPIPSLLKKQETPLNPFGHTMEHKQPCATTEHNQQTNITSCLPVSSKKEISLRTSDTDQKKDGSIIQRPKEKVRENRKTRRHPRVTGGRDRSKSSGTPRWKWITKSRDYTPETCHSSTSKTTPEESVSPDQERDKEVWPEDTKKLQRSDSKSFQSLNKSITGLAHDCMVLHEAICRVEELVRELVVSDPGTNHNTKSGLTSETQGRYHENRTEGSKLYTSRKQDTTAQDILFAYTQQNNNGI